MEYDLLNRPHPHPLLFEEEFNGDAVVCSRCRLPLDSPAFSCSDSICNFHIQESCVHLRPKIHTPLHPQHPDLLLQSSSECCNACGRMSTSSEIKVYKCSKCSFRIDIKCAIRERNRKVSGFWQSGKYVHCSHSHPLEFSTQKRSGGIKKVVCFVCKLLIESGSSTYFCSQCDDAHFHKECAELPREFENADYHPHPLFLQFIADTDDDDKPKICNSCRGPCREGFVYRCPIHLCKFFLHVQCRQSCNHEHKFDKMLQSRMSFDCRICGEQCLDEFPWMCDTCHVLVHKKCAEFPSTLSTTEHEHDLTFNFFPPETDNIPCEICGSRITNYAGYTCSKCEDFTVHLKCAERQRVQSHSTPIVASVPDIQQHPSVLDHNLKSFLPGDIGGDRMCDGCMKCLSVSAPSYGSDQRDLFLHEECAKLPTTIKPTRLHPHLLTLISIPDFLFECEACSQPFHGFAYHCKTCFSTLDVRCATMIIPFKHPNHHHLLYLCETEEMRGETEEMRDDVNCDACWEEIKDKLLFRCSRCFIYLDIACATLPVVVSNRVDPHPLNLTFLEEQRSDDYYCDICEEERELGQWFYSCGKCSFAAHPRCAVGEFPYVKSAMHESHKHPLSLVRKNESHKHRLSLVRKKLGKEEDSGSNYAFQCRLSCNFSVDAMETSYNFTNHNVFYRASQPYDANMDRKAPFLVSEIRPRIGDRIVFLGPFGDTLKSGKAWKECVFSKIRAFVVDGGQRGIESIKIKYEKNGVIVWSKNGEVVDDSEDDKKVISFDYPDEYLVSIHGSIGSFVLSPGKSGEGINSLTLRTNRKTYRLYGFIGKHEFSSEKEGLKICGIFGTHDGDRIGSIGFYGVWSEE